MGEGMGKYSVGNSDGGMMLRDWVCVCRIVVRDEDVVGLVALFGIGVLRLDSKTFDPVGSSTAATVTPVPVFPSLKSALAFTSRTKTPTTCNGFSLATVE
jgi:hypothetical protein